MVSSPLSDRLRAAQTALRTCSSLESLISILSSLVVDLKLPGSHSIHDVPSNHTNSVNEPHSPSGDLQVIEKLIPGIQLVILEYVLSIFAEGIQVDEGGVGGLLERLFTPDYRSSEESIKGFEVGEEDGLDVKLQTRAVPSRTATILAVSAYQTISFALSSNLSHTSINITLHLASLLSSRYPISIIYYHLFGNQPGNKRLTDPAKADFQWTEVMKSIVELQSKCINAWGKINLTGLKVDDLPSRLETRLVWILSHGDR